MSGIFSKMKNGFWDMLNAPGTEPVDETHDDEWYEDEREERVSSRGHRHETQYDETWEYEPEPPRRKENRTTSSRQAQNKKVLEMYGKGDSRPDVVVCHPSTIDDAPKMCDSIRDGKLCIVDLTGMEPNMAQRIADFIGGACYAVNGVVHRVSKYIFVCAPEGMRVSGDIREELEKDGYIFSRNYNQR